MITQYRCSQALPPRKKGVAFLHAAEESAQALSAPFGQDLRESVPERTPFLLQERLTRALMAGILRNDRDEKRLLPEVRDHLARHGAELLLGGPGGGERLVQPLLQARKVGHLHPDVEILLRREVPIERTLPDACAVHDLVYQDVVEGRGPEDFGGA